MAPDLRVAFDVTQLRQSGGGIARYIRSLVPALKRIDNLSVVELGSGPRELPGSLHKKFLTLGLDLAWSPFIVTRKAAAEHASVLHCPAPRGPISKARLPVVITIHDLVPFRFPQTMTRWSRMYSRATHRRMASSADRIICPSRDTAIDVISMLGVPDTRVRVVHLGVDQLFFEAAPLKKNPADPFILFVGTQELRKNLGRLEKAVAILRQRGFPHYLLITGGDAWGDVRLLRDFTRRRGWISDAELRELYSTASCLALPSLHEGFGLPALEAMAVGTPVVAGRAGALPEVTGNAAILVDPFDPHDIARGLEQAITNGTHLRNAGRIHAARFTWERAARATAEVYREIA